MKAISHSDCSPMHAVVTHWHCYIKCYNHCWDTIQ